MANNEWNSLAHLIWNSIWHLIPFYIDFYKVYKALLGSALFDFLNQNNKTKYSNVILEGQQKITLLEINVLAMNIFDQNFIAKFE